MDQHRAFKEKLDGQHNWPSNYMFKFVVPQVSIDKFKALFPDEKLSAKSSKSGKYTSFTLEKVMQSSEEVVEVYLLAQQIDGVIAL